MNNSIDVQKYKLDLRVKMSGSWFFWIAALSIVNSVLYLTDAHLHFLVGLSIATLFDVLGRTGGGVAAVVSTGLSLLAAGLFVMLGVFARKHHLWAFVMGMIFYAMDAILSLVFVDLLSLAFHGYALFRIFSGIQAMNALQKVEASEPRAGSIQTLEAKSVPQQDSGMVPPPGANADQSRGIAPPPTNIV